MPQKVGTVESCMLTGRQQSARATRLGDFGYQPKRPGVLHPLKQIARTDIEAVTCPQGHSKPVTKDFRFRSLSRTSKLCAGGNSGNSPAPRRSCFPEAAEGRRLAAPPRANQLLLPHCFFRRISPYFNSAPADEPPFAIRPTVFQRFSRISLGFQTFSPSSGSQLPVVVFYFCSVEDDELVVFVIVMSPPPLASFFGLRSRTELFFFVCFLDFLIRVFFTRLS